MRSVDPTQHALTLIKFIHEVKNKVNHRVHKVAHTGEHATHYIYLGAVFMESHGFYGKAAGAMLVCLMVADVFKGE